jgi:hypothetical protein
MTFCSVLYYVRFVTVLMGRKGTAVGISCAADGLERSVTDSSLY